MSYPFRVTVSKSIEEVVSTADRIVKKVTLRPVLGDADMKDLLADALEKHGWKPSATPGVYEKEGPEGVHETFDLESMTHTTVAEVSGKIERTETVEAHGDMDFEGRGVSVEEARERLRRKTEQELEKRIRISDEEREARRRELEVHAADALSAGAGERAREWNEIERDVYAEALKEKAKQLGSIVDVQESENGGNFSMTITINERGRGPLANERRGWRGSDAPRDLDRRPVRGRHGGDGLRYSELPRHADRRRERDAYDRGDRRPLPLPRGPRRNEASVMPAPRSLPEDRLSRRGRPGRIDPHEPEFSRGRMGFRAAPVSFEDVARALIADDADFIYDVAVQHRVLVPEVRRQRWFVQAIADSLSRRFRDPDAAARRLIG